MSRRGAALLLLALGACAVASAEVAYSIEIDEYYTGGSYVGYPRDFTGSLMSDENCEPPPPPPGKVSNKVVSVGSFCTPVADTTVTIKLEEGVGELSASPSRRMSAAKPKGTAPPSSMSAAKPKGTAPPSSMSAAKPKGTAPPSSMSAAKPRGPATPSSASSAAAKKPVTKAVAELQVTTDVNGKFFFRISSTERGESSFTASADVGGGIVTNYNTIAWMHPEYTVWPDQEAPSDTIGYNHTLKFTLLLGQIPVRQGTPPSKSPEVPANAPKTLETPYDLPPVAGANLTFFRIDHDLSNLDRAANKLNASKTPSPKDTKKAHVKEEWGTEFGSAITDVDGVVNVEVPSPGFMGQTEVLVVYKDAQDAEWTGYATITWYNPVTPSVEVTDNTTSNITPGQNTTVTVTIVDDAGNPLEDVPVTFNVAGPAYVVETPQRKAPRTLDVVDKVVYTDASGQASAVLASDDPFVNTINISYDISGRIFTIAPFTLTWGAPPAGDFSTIKLAPKHLDVRVGRSANLTATIATDAGIGIEGVRVRFTLTPARQFNNAEAHLEADEGMAATTTSAEIATHFREAVTDAQGLAKLSLSGLMPGRFKVVASATNAAGTLVSSEPSYVSWYGKSHKGNYGYKKQHHDSYDKADRNYREGEHRKEDHRGHKEERDYDKKGSYKRPHSEY